MRACCCPSRPFVPAEPLKRQCAHRHKRWRGALTVGSTAIITHNVTSSTVTTTLVGNEPSTPLPAATAAPPLQRRATEPSTPAGSLTGRQIEEEAMWKQIALHEAHLLGSSMPQVPLKWSAVDLTGAFDKCGLVTKEHAKTFYLGTQLMTPEKARAIWAIYVWCRRTDELVDGPHASKMTPAALDRWEQRLEALFEGRPYDALDAAVTDTVSRFPLGIQPFRDMIGGMRMDLVKSRYESFDELCDYCYRVAGTVALMSMPIMGVDADYRGPLEPVYRAALALGTANQLTNILRDVGEDALQRNRLYVPLDELDQYGISESEVMKGMFKPGTATVDDRWQGFMVSQICRARDMFAQAEAGVNLLDKDARWSVWSALIAYREILNVIEANGYNNFTKRAYVPRLRKLALLPLAFAYAQLPALAPNGGRNATSSSGTASRS